MWLSGSNTCSSMSYLINKHTKCWQPTDHVNTCAVTDGNGLCTYYRGSRVVVTSFVSVNVIPCAAVTGWMIVQKNLPLLLAKLLACWMMLWPVDTVFCIFTIKFMRTMLVNKCCVMNLLPNVLNRCHVILTAFSRPNHGSNSLLHWWSFLLLICY
jgi:hypothetical protein